MEVLQEEEMMMGVSDETIVDANGKEYSVEELRAALDDEEISLLMGAPKSYYVQKKNGKIVGVGPEE